MSTEQSSPPNPDNRPVDKVRDVVVEWIETVAGQGEKALQALGLATPARASVIHADVLETTNDVVVTFDLPGVDPQAIDVVLVGNMLTVKGERAGTVAATGQVLHRRERPVGKFERSIALPVSVDSTQVSADSRHGVLVVRLGKEARNVARQIQVSIRPTVDG